MAATAYLLVALCLTSALLSVIFGIAWRSLGRHRHALLWSITFAVATLQWIVNLSRDGFADRRTYWTVVNAFGLLAVTLAVMGHRQRAGRLPRTAILVGGAVAVELAVVWFTWFRPHVGLQMAVQPMYGGCLIAWAAVVIYRFRPRPLPAERAAAAVHLIFAATQVSAATVAALQGAGGDPRLFDIYLKINFLAMPASYTGMGLFVVFILASDLAETMRQLAVTDPLTGLLNRRGLDEAAQRAVAQARRAGRSVSLVLGDIDRFKSINDSWGHAVGDLAIRRFAEQVRRGRRVEDLVARVGGEEFLLLLPNAAAAEALALAEQIRASLPAAPIDVGDRQVAFTASFGVASASGAGIELDALMRAADRALYRAKGGGRDRVELEPETTLG